MEAMFRVRNGVKYHIRDRVGHIESKYPLHFKHQQQKDGQQPQQRE